MKVLVTGGAGFIGSSFIRYVLRNAADIEIVNFDKLTYAGNLRNLEEVSHRSALRVCAWRYCGAGSCCRCLSAAPSRSCRELCGGDSCRPFDRRHDAVPANECCRHSVPAGAIASFRHFEVHSDFDRRSLWEPRAHRAPSAKIRRLIRAAPIPRARPARTCGR